MAQSRYGSASEKTNARSNRRSIHNGSRSNAPLPIPPGPHRQAGRKRSISRRMRRFESAVGRLDLAGRMTAGTTWLRMARASSWHLSKTFSALLLIGVLMALSAIHSEDDWFIYPEDVHFQGLTYLDAPGLYQQLQVEGWNIFWLQPETLRQRILDNAYIVDARVRLQLPAAIEITVEERRPVALWVTSQGAYWVADNGAALPILDDSAPEVVSELRRLPQIIDPLRDAQIPGQDNPTIDPEILTGALDLVRNIPELENKIRFNQSVGFNFALPQGEGWVYWGDALYLEEKLTNLTAARHYITENNLDNRIVDIRYQTHSYLR